MPRPTSFLAVLLLATLPACGRDSTGTLGGGVSFPPLDPELVQALCVRGDATKAQTKSGDITAGDCEVVIDSATNWTTYFESWRVRVATEGSVTFDASSDFDKRPRAMASQ